MNFSRTKQRRSVSESSSPTVASCLSRWARLGLSPKGMLQEADAIEVWTGPEADDGMSELDTGQVWTPEVAHQTQGLSKSSSFKSQA